MSIYDINGKILSYNSDSRNDHAPSKVGEVKYPASGTGMVYYSFAMTEGNKYYGGIGASVKDKVGGTRYTLDITADGAKMLSDGMGAGTYVYEIQYYKNDLDGAIAEAEAFNNWFYEVPIGDNKEFDYSYYKFNNLFHKTWNAIGDSNTQYPGGYQSWQNSSKQRGYVQAIGDKYYMSAKNNGTGGATWGTATSGNGCAIDKVDKIVSDAVKWDIVTFSFGTNADTLLGTYESTPDEKDTMAGAMRYCIETMQANFSMTKLGVILPTRRSDGNLSNDVLKERCELMKKIAADYGVKVCNMFDESGIITKWLADGLHICFAGGWDYTKPACFHYQNRLEQFLISL